MSVLVKVGRTVKRTIKHFIGEGTVYVSHVRRFERVAINERICAMTFDDGPCALPANPDRFGGVPLTRLLLEVMADYSARGSFDVVGDTSQNYPDRRGREGSPQWGGIRYDHYPDFAKDELGGAVHQPLLIQEILKGGHELTNHGYRHILFGRQPLVYGRRENLKSLAEVTEDLTRLHSHIEENFSYKMTLSRPPHYVDGIAGGFTSYDAYCLMGYGYMAASFDGAGWLPHADGYEKEVELMWQPMAALLNQDPNVLCGQIIFQKDGFNMARRSPVADGLARQLELLSKHGYTVVPVRELLEKAAFKDTQPGSSLYDAAKGLCDAGFAVAYRDNTLRASSPLTVGELSMLLCPVSEQQKHIRARQRGDSLPECCGLRSSHPYYAGMSRAIRAGILSDKTPISTTLSREQYRKILSRLGIPGGEGTGPVTREEAILDLWRSGFADREENRRPL